MELWHFEFLEGEPKTRMSCHNVLEKCCKMSAMQTQRLNYNWIVLVYLAIARVPWSPDTPATLLATDAHVISER